MANQSSQAQAVGTRIADLLELASEKAVIEECTPDELQRMRASVIVLEKVLASDDQVYGITRGFGPLVDYAASDSLEVQGLGLISHLATGQGDALTPDVSRLVMWLRLRSMSRGYSGVPPEFWGELARIWNLGFAPVIPSEGTVSASGDLQPLAHAALALAGTGEVWSRSVDGEWRRGPAADWFSEAGIEPVTWSAREALSFVNGSSVGLAVSLANHREITLLTRAIAALTARFAELTGANPEAYDDGFGIVRGQEGQRTAARWIREALPEDHRRSTDRPLQEPYSLRCAPQVLGAVLDQLAGCEEILLREANGCTDNPICYEESVLHGGNFHAMPVGLSSDQLGLCLQQVAFLAERQLAMLCSPGTNGGLPPMLTPRPGEGSGIAGVQLSATSFVARIRQLVYPSGLTALPTNGGNQDHVPMALNGAVSVSRAVDLAWLVTGSLALAVTQYAALQGVGRSWQPWALLSEASPPLERDRPLAAEVRSARDLMRTASMQWLGTEAPAWAPALLGPVRGETW